MILKHKQNLFIFVLFLVLIAVLQLINYFGVQHFSRIAYNNHLIWGLFGNNFISIIISFILVFFLWLWIYENPKLVIFYLLVLVGVISNVCDRLFYGGAVDYIDLKFFPIFNLADTFIICGLIMIFYQKIRH